MSHCPRASCRTTDWRANVTEMNTKATPIYSVCPHFLRRTSNACTRTFVCQLPLLQVASKDARVRKNADVLAGSRVRGVLYAFSTPRVKGPIELHWKVNAAHPKAGTKTLVWKGPSSAVFHDNTYILTEEKAIINGCSTGPFTSITIYEYTNTRSADAISKWSKSSHGHRHCLQGVIRCWPSD